MPQRSVPSTINRQVLIHAIPLRGSLNNRHGVPHSTYGGDVDLKARREALRRDGYDPDGSVWGKDDVEMGDLRGLGNGRLWACSHSTDREDGT